MVSVNRWGKIAVMHSHINQMITNLKQKKNQIYTVKYSWKINNSLSKKVEGQGECGGSKRKRKC